MKTTLTLLLAVICFTGYSPAAVPGEIGEVPTTNLGSEKFGISSGAVTEGEDVAAEIKLDYSLNNTFFLRGSVQSSQNSDIVRMLGLGGGVYKSWEAARIYGVGELSWNWSRNRAEAFVGGGAAWQPIKDGVLERFSLYVESGIVVGLDRNIGNESPRWRNSAGIRYSF